MNKNRSFVIASERPWNRMMAARLGEKLGFHFVHIDNRDALTAEMLASHDPELVFFPHWSWIVQPEIHTRFECVVFHMTDLPFGRGGSPLQNLITRGIEQTMISALRMSHEVDAGPIYMKRPLSLHGTAEEIFMRASEVIETMIEELVLHKPQPVDQVGPATLFARRTPAQSDLSRARSLKELFDHIRMLDASGYPPAFVDVGPFRFEFSRASLKVGKVVADVAIKVRDDK